MDSVLGFLFRHEFNLFLSFVPMLKDLINYVIIPGIIDSGQVYGSASAVTLTPCGVKLCGVRSVF